MPNNFFQDLRLPNVGEQVFKFTQGKSLRARNPRREVSEHAINAPAITEEEFKGGVCAALSCAWLAEKMRRGHDFEGEFEGAGVHTGRNLATVEKAIPNQLLYRNDGSDDTNLLLLYKLRVDDNIDMPPFAREKMVPGQSSGKIKMTDTLVAVCSEERLRQGKGAYIGVSFVATVPGQTGGDHAVAVYRSNGKTLYFFDPNCGVYKVLDPSPFFGSWIAAYNGMGFAVSPAPGQPIKFIR